LSGKVLTHEVPMDADFSIELGREDPVLQFPWTDPAGNLAYVDLKRHPELITSITEAESFPELKTFLLAINSARSAVETAKCDAWATTDLNAEEDAYNASHKSACYVDIVFSNSDTCLSFAAHEQAARTLVESLRRTPDIPAAAEVCVRRCYFNGGAELQAGFYFTLYLAGYGNDPIVALRNCGAGLGFLSNALETV
jgi:hypothetical protein